MISVCGRGNHTLVGHSQHTSGAGNGFERATSHFSRSGAPVTICQNTYKDLICMRTLLEIDLSILLPQYAQLRLLTKPPEGFSIGDFSPRQTMNKSAFESAANSISRRHKARERLKVVPAKPRALPSAKLQRTKGPSPDWTGLVVVARHKAQSPAFRMPTVSPTTPFRCPV